MLGGVHGGIGGGPPSFGRSVLVVLACTIVGCGLGLGGLGAAVDGGTTAPTSLEDASLSTGPGGASNSSDSPNAARAASSEDSGAPLAVTSDAGAPAPPVDAAPPLDAQPAGPGADGSDSCDVDQDGFKAAGAACGGTDCCDTDSRAHPGETSFFTSADACGSYDYNCNGSEDPEFALVSCALGFLSCSGSGFAAVPPACGVVATFDTCNLTIGCTTTQSQVAQGCQ